MDVRRILSDAGVSAIRSVLASALAILVVPVITNLLETGSYGIWRTVLSFVALVVLVGGLHFHGAMIRYTTSENDSQVFADILFFTTILGALLVPAIVGLGTVLYERFAITSVPFRLVPPAALIVGLRIPGQVLKNAFRARSEVKKYEVVGTLNLVCKLGGLVGVFWLTRSLEAGLWTLAGIDVLLNVSLMAVFYPDYLRWPQPSNFRRYLDYSVPMIPQQMATKILHDADKFLIIGLLGPVAASFYAVAYTVSKVIQSATNIFNSTLYPRVTTAWENEEYDELSRFYTAFSRWYVVGVIPAVCGLVIVGPDLLRVISTPEIARNAAPVLPLLVVAVAFQGIESPLTFVLASAERTRLVAVITVGVTVLNLVLNLLLIPTVGVLGAALATLVAYSGRIVLLYRYSNQHIDIPLQPRYALKSLVAAGVMVGVLSVIPDLPPVPTLVAYPALGSCVFAVVFVAVGGLSERDRTLLSKYAPFTLP